MTDSRDFSLDSPTTPRRVVQFNVEDDIETGRTHRTSDPTPLQTRSTFQTQSEPELSDTRPAPILKRRQSRSNTARTLRAVNPHPTRLNWQPGQEPGIDPSKPNGGHPDRPTLSADCEINVVDYSEDDMVMYKLDNDTLPGWLEKHGNKEEWVKCRWINVNGLSWDVISALGKYKRLHRLAIEDLMNTRNRTKADWYVSVLWGNFVISTTLITF
jgi:hypothetical protein